MKHKSNELIKTIKLKSLSSEIVKKTESHFKNIFLNLFKNAMTKPVNTNSTNPQNKNSQIKNLTNKISNKNKSLQNNKNKSSDFSNPQNGKFL